MTTYAALSPQHRDKLNSMLCQEDCGVRGPGPRPDESTSQTFSVQSARARRAGTDTQDHSIRVVWSIVRFYLPHFCSDLLTNAHPRTCDLPPISSCGGAQRFDGHSGPLFAAQGFHRIGCRRGAPALP